jgi:hypothetical protein
MRRNAEQEIRGALIEAIKACGLPTPDDDLIKGKKPPDLKSKKGVLQAVSSTLLAIGMQSPNIRRKPKDEADLDRRLEQIRQVPFAFRPLLDEMLTQLRSTATGSPRGPKPRLTDRQRRNATNSISTLIANGMSAKYSISKIAESYGVTPRLMRKAWERRNHT